MGCMYKANGLYSRMTVGAVLLAAGAGERMGGRPKALLELGGVPLVLRQLIALSGAGVDEVAVVLGHHGEAIEAAVRPFPITLVRNPSPDDGQVSSVRLGRDALSPKLDAVIVALADQPLIDAQDIVALISAFRKRGDAAMDDPPQSAGRRRGARQERRALNPLRHATARCHCGRGAEGEKPQRDQRESGAHGRRDEQREAADADPARDQQRPCAGARQHQAQADRGHAVDHATASCA